jgi:hypothetical protein
VHRVREELAERYLAAERDRRAAGARAGCHRPALAVMDGSKALRRAVTDVFCRPVIARCQLNKIRNVQNRLPGEAALSRGRPDAAGVSRRLRGRRSRTQRLGRRAGQDPPRGGGQPREFTIRTSIGRLRVAECGLCGTLTIQDGGQLRHIALHEATGTLGPDLARGGST